MSAALLDLLGRRDALASAFQPILSLGEGRCLGYEALLRLPQGVPYDGPQQAFDAAAATELLVELEIAALETHLREAAALPEGVVFLNLSASAFLDARMEASVLERWVRAAGLAPQRLVLELTELVRLPEPAGFAAALRPLRDLGFRLAVDDFGAGFSNVAILVELGPDFVKLDRCLIAGVAGHPRKRAFLESMAALGRRIGCDVIAEGVESAEDLAAVRACGIPYGQGWALVRPAPLAWLLEGPARRRGSEDVEFGFVAQR